MVGTDNRSDTTYAGGSLWVQSFIPLPGVSSIVVLIFGAIERLGENRIVNERGTDRVLCHLAEL
jgi:hypothetical protein